MNKNKSKRSEKKSVKPEKPAAEVNKAPNEPQRRLPPTAPTFEKAFAAAYDWGASELSARQFYEYHWTRHWGALNYFSLQRLAQIWAITAMTYLPQEFECERLSLAELNELEDLRRRGPLSGGR